MTKMAAVQTKNLLVALWACFCTFVYCKDALYVTHSPSYVEFQKDAGPIDVAELQDVITLALGFENTKDLNWGGLSVGDLFHRPKANILITIETTDKEINLDLGSKTIPFPLQGGGEVNLQSLRNNIASMYGEDKPLMLEVSPDVKGVQVSSGFQDVFKTIPDTVTGMLPLLQGDHSILQDNNLGSLNLSNHADVSLLSELQILREIVIKLKENPAGVSDNIPDVFSLSLSGLRVIQSKYGNTSPQANDALALLSSFLTQFSADIIKLYNGDVLIEVMTSHQDPLVSRHGRSLLQNAKATTAPPATPQIANRAPSYSEDYPVIFNIILWMVIILALAIYVVAYGLGTLDPGDTIIYRMTSQRMKID
ncbi:renin receptor-like [Asterias rubens]|uniref:renin receptor-like n=1 Tax=Asterias rubens TaxID=7604 RepID=UPI0014551D8D|nr:renin receptor-like [Asterias rubens]